MSQVIAQLQVVRALLSCRGAMVVQASDAPDYGDKCYHIEPDGDHWKITLFKRNEPPVIIHHEFSSTDLAIKFAKAHWVSDQEIANLTRLSLPVSGSKGPLFVAGTDGVVYSTGPWGEVDECIKYGDGVFMTTTPSHGGFILSPERQAAMPDHLRLDVSYYEEDCDWARVALAFPELFTSVNLFHAERTVMSLYPDLYEAHFQRQLLPGESYVRDNQNALKQAGPMDYLASSASLDKSKWPGIVICSAVPCSDLQARINPKSSRVFLIPESEYTAIRQDHFCIFSSAKYPEVLHLGTPDERVIPVPPGVEHTPAPARKSVGVSI